MHPVFPVLKLLYENIIYSFKPTYPSFSCESLIRLAIGQASQMFPLEYRSLHDFHMLHTFFYAIARFGSLFCFSDPNNTTTLSLLLTLVILSEIKKTKLKSTIFVVN